MTEVDLVLPHQIAMKQLKQEEEDVAKARPEGERLPVEVKVEVKEEEVVEEVDDDRPTKLDLRTLRSGEDLVPEFSPVDFPTPVPPPVSPVARGKAPEKHEQKDKDKDKDKDKEDEDQRPTNIDLRTPSSGEYLVPEFSPDDFPSPSAESVPKKEKGAEDDKRPTDPDVRTPYKGPDVQQESIPSATPTVEVRTPGILADEHKSRTWLVLVVTILVLAALCLGYLLGRTTG